MLYENIREQSDLTVHSRISSYNLLPFNIPVEIM